MYRFMYVNVAIDRSFMGTGVGIRDCEKACLGPCSHGVGFPGVWSKSDGWACDPMWALMLLHCSVVLDFSLSHQQYGSSRMWDLFPFLGGLYCALLCSMDL